MAAAGDENGQIISVPAASASPAVAAVSKNGSKMVATESGGGGKSAKYKSLWGKVGKHGMLQAAAAAASTNATNSAETSSTSSAGSRSKKTPASSGWDQVLTPLIHKQRAQYTYHAQQVQMGAAVAGSGWTGANMECDCGEDSCPRCNLMLNMGMDDPPYH